MSNYGRRWSYWCGKLAHDIEMDLPFWSGLRFFHKTNSRREYSIVARYWPHRLCWSWCLHINLWGEKFYAFKFTMMRGDKNHGHLWYRWRFTLLGITLSFDRQDSDWMLNPQWCYRNGYTIPDEPPTTTAQQSD